MTAEPAEADDDVRREERLDLEKLAVVQHARDHLAHVVRLVGCLGNDRLQLGVGTFEVVGGRQVRWRLAVAGWKVRQELAHSSSTCFLRSWQEVRHS